MACTTYSTPGAAAKPAVRSFSSSDALYLGLACLIASMVLLLVPAVVLGTLGVPSNSSR